MNIEFEATFPGIDKKVLREKLKALNAKLIKKEFIQKRSVFHFPAGHQVAGGWVRVRDEVDTVTMSIKIIDGDFIENQKEICLSVDDYAQAELFLQTLGCEKKAYQESKRELWSLDNGEVMIDEWPFLEPFVEIEGASEESVKQISEKLGFKYEDALFCSVAELYEMKYGVSQDIINNQTPLIVFGSQNPFIQS
ncbi:MAG TPA: CYTH domain-containing protein [Candidatus Woesebacteria bacterium]|nr:CYTH domain-containing protein [Candidatus Woesebacteria bacterium]